MDTAALREEVTRGVKAKELLENEILQDALKAVESEVVDAWAACPQRDAEGKEALWQLYKTAQKFRLILNGYIESGKLATEQLKRFERENGLKAKIRSIVNG